jgi:glucose-1-phosphate thymidylyltransferase
MKALIIAAGYATRLFPLTKDFPKPLLEVGGRPILDWLFEQIEGIPAINGAYVVTNSRFAGHFENWRAGRTSKLPVEILDDGTSTNETRLGAVGDIQLAIEQYRLDDDLFVAAADNILLFPLASFINAFQNNPSPYLCVHHVEEIAARQRTGIAQLDDADRIIRFEEKPREPKSAWGVPPLYIYPRAILPRIAEYLAVGGNPDAPGHFVEWLSRIEACYAWRMEGSVLDIGNLESLEAARRRFSTPQNS